MTDAFELNLKAMSLLALLVGTFLIYNTLSFSVLQRRELLASLRILGATRGQLLREILAEAALLGLAGGLLGLLLGALAAQALLRMVTRTINDLYFVLTVTDFALDPAALLRGLALGVLAAVAAAAGPALEAAWAPPVAARARSGAEGAARRALPWLAGAGLLALLAGYGLLQSGDSSQAGAFGGVFLLLLGYGLATPWLLLGLCRLAARLARRAWLARLAVRGVAASVSRAGPAVAALAVAGAVSIGVGTMIDSFRGTVAEWLGQILQADLYVAAPSPAARHSPPLPGGLAEKLGRLDGVARFSTGRRLFVAGPGGQTELLVLDPPYPAAAGFRFKQADSQALWDAFPGLEAVFVSEPYAEKHRLRVGDRIELASDEGALALPVAGVFFDYRSDQGLVVMHRALFERHWKDRRITSLGLYLKPGADLGAVRAAAERVLGGERQALSVRSNREIRESSMETFERTFAITLVLRILAAAVAFIGILSALLAFQCERGRELAVLRATGLTPAQASRLVLLQTGFMGLAAGLLAVPAGVAVAAALVRVVNLRSFGWTMDLAVSPPALALAVALSVLAALLAGLYPAWLAARAEPAALLREE
jgi:putative ABC transport system permease protein